MDVTQKMIVVLLILSIVFSVVSIAISYSASQINLPGLSKKVSGNAVGGGNAGLNFYVEKNSVPSQGSG